jgi:CDGSH-type Zn-finger protein
MADETTVTLRNNGPYMIQGKIKIVDPEGNEVQHEGDVAVLCRCGGSSNKPFCDGTHRSNGFKS